MDRRWTRGRGRKERGTSTFSNPALHSYPILSSISSARRGRIHIHSIASAALHPRRYARPVPGRTRKSVALEPMLVGQRAQSGLCKDSEACMECNRGERMKAGGVESAQDVVKRGSLKEDDAEGGRREDSRGVKSPQTRQ
jgi:hypothetical protein